MKRTLEEAIKSKGLETEIKNIIYHLIRNTIKSDGKSSTQSVLLFSELWKIFLKKKTMFLMFRLIH